MESTALRKEKPPPPPRRSRYKGSMTGQNWKPKTGPHLPAGYGSRLNQGTVVFVLGGISHLHFPGFQGCFKKKPRERSCLGGGEGGDDRQHGDVCWGNLPAKPKNIRRHIRLALFLRIWSRRSGCFFTTLGRLAKNSFLQPPTKHEQNKNKQKAYQEQ